MPVANLANMLQIVRHRRHRAGGCADYRLSHERHHGLWAQPHNFLLQGIGEPSTVSLGHLSGVGKPIFEAGVDQRDVYQQRLIWRAAPRASAGGKRAERVAMVAKTPSDHTASARITPFEVILPRKLERRLHGFGSAAGVPNPVEPARRHFGDQRRQLFGRVGREKAGMHVLELRGLVRERGDDFGMAVPEARHRGTPARIDIAPALGIDQEYALATHGDRRARFGRTMEDVPRGHWGRLTSAAAASMARRIAFRSVLPVV